MTVLLFDAQWDNIDTYIDKEDTMKRRPVGSGLAS